MYTCIYTYIHHIMHTYSIIVTITSNICDVRHLRKIRSPGQTNMYINIQNDIL